MNLPLLTIGSTGLDVVTAQRLLTAAGFFAADDGSFGKQTETATKLFQRARGLTDDGKIGKNTWAALMAEKPVVAPQTKPIPAIASPREPIKEVPVDLTTRIKDVDARSEKVIKTLLPQIQERARQLIRDAAANRIDIKIISGLRSYDEQNALYAKGRTAKGSKVTNAKGGQSWHNHGCAFDVGVFNGSEYLGESPHYETVGELGEALGFEWGGRWKFKDAPHFQDANGKTIAQAQALHKKGKTVFDA